jgi:hypothetical protein
MPTWIEALTEYCWRTPPKDTVQWNAKNFLVSGPIVKVKFGGRTKESEVYPNGRPGVYCLKEQFKVFPNEDRHFDLHTGKPTKSIVYNIPIELIIELIENFNGIDGILYAALNHEERKKTARQGPKKIAATS